MMPLFKRFGTSQAGIFESSVMATVARLNMIFQRMPEATQVGHQYQDKAQGFPYCAYRASSGISKIAATGSGSLIPVEPINR